MYNLLLLGALSAEVELWTEELGLCHKNALVVTSERMSERI